MREFTVRKRIGQATFNHVQQYFELQIPRLVIEYLEVYSGLSVCEDTYVDKNGLEWIFSEFTNNKDFMKLPIEFKNGGWGDWIIFGHDEGGWHFCLGMSKENYNAVFINRWTDHKAEEQFLKIADSFNDFITNLKKNSSRI